MTLPVKAKMPLNWAAHVLSSLCDQIDGSPEIDDALIQAFTMTEMALAKAIDRRKALMWQISGHLAAARGMRAEIDEQVQKLKAIEKKVKLSTLVEMEAHQDLPWRDSCGKRLWISKNAEASLKLTFDIKEKRTFTNLVHGDTVRNFDIPEKYLTRVTITTLNTDAVKADLEAGAKLIWATAERGRHVCGLSSKKEEVSDDASDDTEQL